MEDSTLLLTAIFIMMLALCLAGLFVHIVVATRADSRRFIQHLKAATMKIQQLDNAVERTFGEFQYLLEKKMKFMFIQIRKRKFDSAIQTDEDEELGLERQDAESQTELARQNSLPPLLVRPALSSDVVIPISE